jgi:hypothetical protein
MSDSSTRINQDIHPSSLDRNALFEKIFSRDLPESGHLRANGLWKLCTVSRFLA